MKLFQHVKWLIPGLALAVSACSESVPNTGTQSLGAANSGWAIDPGGDLNEFFECLEDEGRSLISAHRGGPKTGYPENTLETMAALLEDIPAILEIDVATSADGVLYLLHDDALDRTTTGSGDSNALAWAEIKNLKLKDNAGRTTGFAPSRFDDVLAWAKHRTILQVDFKRSTNYSDVAREIHRQGAEDRVILIAYSIASAAKLHRLMPDAMVSISLASQSGLNRAVAAGIPDNRILGFTGTDDPDPRLFSTLNGRDVEVIFGTLGGRDSIDDTIARSGYDALYAEIAADGVDIIATDRPIKAQASLAKAGRGVEAGICGVTKTVSN